MTLSRNIRTALIAFLAVVYAILTIRYHDWAQQFVISVQKEPAWTWGAVTGIVIILGSMALLFTSRWKPQAQPGRNRTLLILWISTAVFVGLSHWLLMSVHTEAIHFLQYGIFSAMVFSVVRRIPATMMITTLVGMLDEAYQFWFLYPDWPVYYDFNDVILNSLAGGMMLLFLLSTFPEMLHDDSNDRWPIRNIDMLLFAVIAFVFVTGVSTGLIALYKYPDLDMSKTLLLLHRTTPPDNIWYYAWWSGKHFLALSSVNGLIILFLIPLFYRTTLPRLRIGSSS